MGPSVKFVLTIIDEFPNQKNGCDLIVAKKVKPWFDKFAQIGQKKVPQSSHLSAGGEVDAIAIWFNAQILAREFERGFPPLHDVIYISLLMVMLRVQPKDRIFLIF